MLKINIQGFISYCENNLNLSKHSLLAYRQDLGVYKAFLATQNMAGFSCHEILLNYQAYLSREKQSSASTVKRRFSTLRTYYRWLVDTKVLECSPFEGAKLKLKVPKRLPRPVDRPTLKLLTDSLSGKQGSSLHKKGTRSQQRITDLIIRLLIHTGMRIGEITNLRLGDISEGCVKIGVKGKGNKERSLYVTNIDLLDRFRFYWSFRTKLRSASDFLFLNSRNERLTEAAFRKRLRVIGQSLSIEQSITPHRFRHSAATLLLEEGVDIRIIQRLLGHSSITTTEIYTQVADNSLIKAIRNADTLAKIGA